MLALPPVVEAPALAALTRLPGKVHLRWSEAEQTLTREPADLEPPPATLATAVLDGGIRASCHECTGLTLVVATPGLTLVENIAHVGPQRGLVFPPRDFLESAARHYSGPALWWLEERREGRLWAMREVREISLAADPVNAFLESAASIRPAQRR